MYKIIENTAITSVIGDFNSNYYIILFQNDSFDYGIMHLAEHYIIRMIKKKDKSFWFGKTDFGYMFLLSRGEYIHLTSILDIIDAVCQNSISKFELIESKEEVIKEINQSDLEKLNVFRFASNGKINCLPVGNADYIRNVSCKDMEKFLKEKIYKSYDVIYIGKEKLPYSLKKLNKFIYYSSLFSGVKIYTLNNNLYIYYNFHYNSESELYYYYLFKIFLYQYLQIKNKEINIFEKSLNINNKLLYFVLNMETKYKDLIDIIKDFDKENFIDVKFLLLNKCMSEKAGELQLEEIVNETVQYKVFGDKDILFYMNKIDLHGAIKNFEYYYMKKYMMKIFHINIENIF